MKILTLNNKATHVLVLATAIFGIQLSTCTINVNAQTSEAEQINQMVRDAWREGDSLINQSLEQERQYISRLSCSQLKSEAIEYQKAGDRMADQGYTSQAQGYYNSAGRRADAYSRNCR
jgi:hypothetical protein